MIRLETSNNSGSSTYTFTTHPYRAYTFNSSGAADGSRLPAALDQHHLQQPRPGLRRLSLTATSCDTVTSASGRALVIASNSAGEVSKVIDPLGRAWTYTYCSPPSSTCSSGDLVSVTDPLGNVTSYHLRRRQLEPRPRARPADGHQPNGQSGGPDAGDEARQRLQRAGQVTSQTDPQREQDQLRLQQPRPVTGNGYTLVTDPDGNETQYVYQQRHVLAKPKATARGSRPPGPTTPTPPPCWSRRIIDPNGNTTTYSLRQRRQHDHDDQPARETSTASLQQLRRADLRDAAAGRIGVRRRCRRRRRSRRRNGHAALSAPPKYVTYSLYDTGGNPIWTTTGDYNPGDRAQRASHARATSSTPASRSRSDEHTISCAASPPSTSLPCATIDPNARRQPSSATTHDRAI